jgi:hypothetical protein
MRCRFLPAASILFLALLLPASSRAGYRYANASESPGASIRASVACSGGPATMVAWEEGPGEIRTRLTVDGGWQPFVSHGAGNRPVLGWGVTGVILAHASGTDVVVREGAGAAWSPPVFLGNEDTVSSVDLWCAATEDVDPAYLVWETSAGQVRFSCRTAAGWSAPATIYQAAENSGPLEPQVCPTTSGGGSVPRVYFLVTPNLKYVQRDGSTWTAPSTVTTLPSAGTDFDVAAGPDLRHSILCLTPQPT